MKAKIKKSVFTVEKIDFKVNEIKVRNIKGETLFFRLDEVKLIHEESDPGFTYDYNSKEYMVKQLKDVGCKVTKHEKIVRVFLKQPYFVIFEGPAAKAKQYESSISDTITLKPERYTIKWAGISFTGSLSYVFTTRFGYKKNKKI